MHMLTTIGDSDPMVPEEVQLYFVQIRKDLEQKKCHPYIFNRRMWAQKPFDTKTKEEKALVVETVA